MTCINLLLVGKPGKTDPNTENRRRPSYVGDSGMTVVLAENNKTWEERDTLISARRTAAGRAKGQETESRHKRRYRELGKQRHFRHCRRRRRRYL